MDHESGDFQECSQVVWRGLQIKVLTEGCTLWLMRMASTTPQAGRALSVIRVFVTPFVDGLPEEQNRPSKKRSILCF